MNLPENIPEFAPLKFSSLYSVPNPSNFVTIYTTFRILQRIRTFLGLEAMLDYMGKYLILIEKNNPQLKIAVTQALKIMDVEKMYRDAVGENER